MNLSPQKTDWANVNGQQPWFDKFAESYEIDQSNSEVVNLSGHSKKHEAIGLKLTRFHGFLCETIYQHIANLGKATNAEAQCKFSYQQEMQLFRIFDTNNDHIIDRDEFANLCQNWIQKIFRRNSALLVVDVQNDFISGSLALIKGPAGQDGLEVVQVINRMMAHSRFSVTVYTHDWHPVDHIGFYDNLHLRKYSTQKSVSVNASIDEEHPTGGSTNGEIVEDDGNSKAEVDNNSEQITPSRPFKLGRLVTSAKVFDTVWFEDGRVEQKLWPVHCVQGSWGAELHQNLVVQPNAIHIYKGTIPNVDAYSAFWDNMRLNETGLKQELKSRNVDDVFVCGLALDYCVAASALDSARAGFITYVVEDACRGIDEESIKSCKQQFLENGVFIIQTKDVNGYLMQASSGNGTTRLDGSDNCVDGQTMLQICFRRALSLTI